MRLPKLTSRQRAFLDSLLDLYQEAKTPVHYTDVAERLGVNRFSAYDMLKVLEGKGFVSSSYALAVGHSGPGRSIVVFEPTPQANALALRTSLGLALDEEWPGVRQRVLRWLSEARDANYREALGDLLAHVPSSQAPLSFCAGMIGALLLNMRRARDRAEGLSPFRALRALQAGGSGLLETLAGLSVGATLSAHDEIDRSLTQQLLERTHDYQNTLDKLSNDARAALLQLLEEALEALD